MEVSVATFTDTYLPTVNGVTYTISSWRDRFRSRGNRMDVVYPGSNYDPDPGEYPARSLPFPFYEGFRVGLPQVPRAVRDVDVVHAHSPFSLGVAGLRLAREESLPFVVSYHTPTREYASYVVPGLLAGLVGSVSHRWERWFLERADLVIAPSEVTAEDLRTSLRTETTVRTLPNGVDTELFRPVETEEFRNRYGLGNDRPLLGYTGRHGYEKNLDALLEAAADIDTTVVLGGEGPATESLRKLAADLGADARFLGFLDREELPEFYSAIDVFGFPSPVETQGIVALESTACGTPVVGVDAGALTETIDDGVTGYHYPEGDRSAFARKLDRAIENRSTLEDRCLGRRESISLDRSIDALESVYGSMLDR
ncbi:MAG: glycosyltransferase [Halodesulfurarchaeum sp.]